MIPIPSWEYGAPLERGVFADRSVTIFTEARPKPAHKSGKNGRAFIDAGFRSWEIGVATAFADSIPNYDWEPFPEAALELGILTVLPRTKELMTVFKRTNEPKYPTGLIPIVAKPDEDNLSKSIVDALSRARLVPRYRKLLDQEIERRLSMGKSPDLPKSVFLSLWDEASTQEAQELKREGTSGKLWDDQQITYAERMKAYCELEGRARIHIALEYFDISSAGRLLSKFAQQ